MIDFQIEKKNYTIKELTIRDYYEIAPYFEKDDMASKYEVVSGLSKAQVSELKKLKLADWTLLWATLEKVISLYFSDNIGEIIDEFNFQDTDYGLIDMERVTVGEFADLDILVNQENSSNKLHEILAILYRPIIKRGLRRKKIMAYEDIDFHEQAEIFKDLPLKYVKSALSFFLLLGNQSFVSTLDSLTREIRQSKDLSVQDKEKLLALVRVLLEDGGELSTSYPEKIQLITNKLQDLLSTKDSTSSAGNTPKLKKKTEHYKTN